MSLSSMKQEELELLSYTDLTELILMENGSSMNTANIFKKISELISLTEEEYASKIGDFYTSLTTDKRFIFLEDTAEWDLRNRHTAEIVVTDDDDEDEEEIEEEEEEEIEEENLEDDIDSVDTSEDDLDDDDDIGDLSIITDEELEEN
jgi:DNA-directed RNA polymerase subunit delta